ncbi:MAG: hypothetical protein IJ833_05690 [Lachnospiraceae bacterium]|nr:hypothetical protein [Lachnospiraceae bacterium]
MERKVGSEQKDKFSDALLGKNIPVLTLDNKWYRLLDEIDRASAREIENKLNELLKRQGKLNTESKEIKKIKKKLMNEIVPIAGEADKGRNSQVDKKLEEHKRLIAECNEKLESYQDELLELPREIEKLNYELMMLTMECCYDTMQQNTDEIMEISDWVTDIRIELKKRLIHKQEMEQKNHDIYSYMHDIFGADVVNLFDMKYNPEEQHPKASGHKNE